MDIELIAPGDLRPNPRNPRHLTERAIDEVAKSIEASGFLNPIVIDGDGMVLAGHTRREAALKLGLSEVPCVRASHLSQGQATAFMLADNRLAEMTDWDQQGLAELLSELPEVPVGFTDDEVDGLAELLEAAEVTPQAAPTSANESGDESAENGVEAAPQVTPSDEADLRETEGEPPRDDDVVVLVFRVVRSLRDGLRKRLKPIIDEAHEGAGAEVPES